MNTITVTRLLEWDMAHRLGHGYQSKCKHLHGHRYRLEVTAACPKLDRFGMVIDFASLKTICGGWIDENLDHAMLVCDQDQTMIDLLDREGQRHFVVPFNTTAENIVDWLAAVLQGELDRTVNRTQYVEAAGGVVKQVTPERIVLTHLKLFETPNGWAEWSCKT